MRRSCRGAAGAGGGRRQLGPGSFVASSFVTSVRREMPNLPVGGGERAPLMCLPNFQELPLI